MTRPVVALTRWDDAGDAVRKAIELCDGLAGFRSTDRILIKPNLVFWDFDLPFPPYGVVSTTAVVSALVRLLHEEGFRHVTIGEAPLPVPASRGREIFRALGYERLRDRYQVELVDFNEEPFVPVPFGEFSLRLARRALEADCIINVPVLKTHNQSVVSLGLKNLKGCLSKGSKVFCHHPRLPLDHLFPRIVEHLPVALTIIDGLFTLERGPGPTGRAYRKDLLLASRDAFACDVVGAALMGYSTEDVPHLGFFARRHGRRPHLDAIEIRGEDLATHRFRVEYDWEWTEDDTGPAGFRERGITGIAVRKYDDTLCTGCSTLFNPMLIMLMAAYRGQPFPDVEVVSGKRQLAQPGFARTVLFGRCSCRLNRDNPHIRKAIPLPGCPPDLGQFVTLMREQGIACDPREYVRYRHYLLNRYRAHDGFDHRLYDFHP
ncbi:MAG: DUF362 domain-containing protein [Bacillota bacterium]